MREQRIKQLVLISRAVATVLFGCALSLVNPVAVAACSVDQQSCSAGYGVNEAFFGAGGQLHACDSNGLCAKQAAGETGIGNTAVSAYQAQAGFNTDRIPSLTFIINTTSVSLGTLTAGVPATGTATFSVKTYPASGYQVVTASPPPVNGSYTLTALSSPAASNPAVEQFGINLVANNSCAGGLPASLGANPVQVPDSSFSFGAAATGYNTACQFKYVNNDVIASSTKSSGETDFTISYIANITNTTAGGFYTMGQSLVATSTF